MTLSYLKLVVYFKKAKTQLKNTVDPFNILNDHGKEELSDFCDTTIYSKPNATWSSRVQSVLLTTSWEFHIQHQYLPTGNKILYLLSCHSSAQATLIIPWQLLTHFKASVALNSIPKPRSCCILRILSPNIISGREGMCNSSANLHRKIKIPWGQITQLQFSESSPCFGISIL